MSDMMREGLSLSLVGLVSVFVVLAGIALVVDGLRRLDQRARERSERRAAESGRVAQPPEQTIDETTLVIISAAVATVLRGRYHIRRVRRLSNARGEWAQRGRAEVQGSHSVDRLRK